MPDRFARVLEQVVLDLGATDPVLDIGAEASFVHGVMSGPLRDYHGPEHALSVAAGDDPIDRLAGLYHDLVYLQLDRWEVWEPHLGATFRIADGWIHLRPGIDDLPLRLCLAVFGFDHDTFSGPTAKRNELLSALIAARRLAMLLSPPRAIELIVGIWGTVPFRTLDADGRSVSEALEDRLAVMGAAESLAIDASFIRGCLTRANRVAHRDLGHFASEDPGEFLSHTWKLMPEQRPELADLGTPLTVGGYRGLLAINEGFFSSFITPELVFPAYREQPPAQILAARRAAAQRNIATAQAYFRVKLFSVAILEAIAAPEGGDPPIADLMGAADGSPAGRLEAVLPEPLPAPPGTALEDAVHLLLRGGRAEAASFDIKGSPLSAYLAGRLGLASILALHHEVKRYIAGDLSADGLLLHLPDQVRRELADALERTAGGAT